MIILGISAFYHDSAAVLLIDGRIVAAVQEERFSRKKHDAGFPINAIRYCLEESGITTDQIDIISFYDKPFLKFERLLETYFAYAPKGWLSFIASMPVWIKEKLFLKKMLRDGMEEIGPIKAKWHFPEHHLSHAASAFYPSPFDSAAILTIDGVGEWATASICKGEGNNITLLREMHFPHSLGLLYSAFTYFIGFRVNSGEYKLMGLAPYGDPNSEQTKAFKKTIADKLCKVYADGSIWLDQQYFSYATSLRMVPDDSWAQLFGFPLRQPETPIEQHHCNLALAIQQFTEEVVIRMATTALALTGTENLCLAGGVALNCVANGKLLEKNIAKNIFIQPAAGDAGGALGAALATWYIGQQQARTPAQPDAMQGAFLGPRLGAADAQKAMHRFGAKGTAYDNDQTLTAAVAQLLSEGKVVGWCHGRMEWGPRALGHRSIIGDPRNGEMQRKLNVKIKFRESFRPFAPLVAAEAVERYFDLKVPSPYMLLVAPVKAEWRKPLPENYSSLSLKDKLYVERSVLPAITHIDFSARVQTVSADSDARTYALLKAFENISGHPVLINTSFNVRGEPIVCTALDAYRCFMRTDMDVLVLDKYVFLKEEQPEWKESREWQQDLTMD